MNGKIGKLNDMMTKIKIKPEITEGVQTAALYALTFICGFVLTLGTIVKNISPFGAAFALCLPFAYMPSAAAGAVLGYIFTCSSEQTVRYIAAIIIGGIVLVTFYRVLGKVLKSSFTALVVGFCVAVSGIATAVGMGEGSYEILLAAAEGVISGCFCWFFKIAVQCFNELKNNKIIKSSHLAAVMIVASVFLLSLSSFEIYNVSAARIIASFVIMICGLYGKESAGAVAGVGLGCILGFSGESYFTGAAYSFGGLLAGLASGYGRFLSVVGYIIGNCIIVLLADDFNIMLPAAVEVGIAGLAVIILPKKAESFFSSFFIRPGISPESESMRELLSFKLRVASATVYDVSNSVKTVSKALAGINKRNERAVYSEVREDVCRGCRRKNNCWEYNFEKTVDSFNRMTMSRKNGEIPSAENLPPYLSAGCIYIEALTESFNKYYSAKEFKEAAENRVAQARAVAADQFTSISVMLENLAEELQRDIIFAPETAIKAQEAIEYMGLHVIDSVCVINEGGYAVLQVFCSPSKRKIGAAELARAVSENTGINFENPVIGENDSEKILLLFCESSLCTVSAAMSQFIGDGQSVCGDSCDYFNDGRGHYIMILSDGMGTGSRAAVDGTMTTCLASKLIKAGFSFDCVVKTVNSALMVKSRDESLSTLDIVSIDLFRGEAAFYKAGAAVSLICRRGKVIRIERSSLPLGILRDVEFERVTGRIGDGDIIVMMSDGASSIPQDVLRKTLVNMSEKSPQEIATTIASLAKDESPTGRNDDITVIAAVVRRKQK